MHCEVDSIRIAIVCPDQVTLILRQKGASSHVRIWISQHESRTLAGNNATDSGIGLATVYL